MLVNSASVLVLAGVALAQDMNMPMDMPMGANPAMPAATAAPAMPSMPGMDMPAAPAAPAAPAMPAMPGMEMPGMDMPGMDMGKMPGMEMGGQANSLEKQCKMIKGLEKFTMLAGNTTQVNEFIANATKAAAIEAKAAMAKTKLEALQANTTLMNECTTSGLFAMEDMKFSCKEMEGLQKLNKVIANETKLNMVTMNDAAQAGKLKALAADKAGDLNNLQSNQTLTQFCSVQKTQQDCKKMNKLQKMEEEAKNQTALSAMFKGDAEKVSKFQAKAAEQEPKLKALMDNSTLMDACSKMPESATGLSNAAAQGSSMKSSANKGAAISLVAVFLAALVVL